MLVHDSGANASIFNGPQDFVFDIEPVHNLQAKMANKSKLPIQATCSTGIPGFEKFYIAKEGTMPRSLNSVGLTADAGMITVMDSDNAYILKAGERVNFKADQIAHIIPRCKKTGLYMCPWSQAVQPASVFFEQQRAPARKVPATPEDDDVPGLSSYSDDEDDA
jgi:hypothetical protein